jgi:hypothetical protein
MEPEQINEEVARACGWTKHKIDYAPIGGGSVFETFWLPPGVDINTLTAEGIAWGPSHGRSVPNYFGDLNHCAEMEMTLTPDGRYEYMLELARVCQVGATSYHVFSSAPQRCEAFLRTKELWSR